MALLLELDDVYKSFGGLTAVNGLNIRINSEDVCSIIGPNGAGKTTVFNMITGMFQPTKGKIIFKGLEMNSLEPHQINRKGISRSFQITNLFQGLSVYENVRIACQSKNKGLFIFSSVGKLSEVNDRTMKILKTIDLWEKRAELAGSLSHGDQRCLEIGVALSSEPELLLLDEPTAGMTPHETKETIKLIKRLKEQLTILMIEHDMEVVMGVSDFIVVMHQGKKLAEGVPDQIRTNAEVMEAYFGGESQC